MTTQFIQMLDDLQRRSLRMAGLVTEIVGEALEAVVHTDRELAANTKARDDEVDEEETKVEAEVIRLLALYQPAGSDLRLLCTILKVNNDLERVADCAVNIAERTMHLDLGSIASLKGQIVHMGELVDNILRKAISAYAATDASKAREVLNDDDAIDAYYGQIIKQVVADAAEAAEQLASCLDLLSIAKNLERIADHATNIAEDVIYLSTGRIVRHGVNPVRNDVS